MATPSSSFQSIGASCFDTCKSLSNHTFDFARSDGITAEAADAPPQYLGGFFPAEQVYTWSITKQIQLSSPILYDEVSNTSYKPIADPQEIRILEIYPGRFDDNLQGTLHHCSVEFENEIPVSGVIHYPTKYALSSKDLNQPIWYTALSYTWGGLDTTRNTVIECDGFELRITHSLDLALRHFRQSDHSINMWIDQICINQEDITEKEQQIPLMSKIYGHAVSTVVWLGEATEGSDDAFDLLLSMNDFFQGEVDAPPPEKFEESRLPGSTDTAWKHLWDLLNRRWFSRLWIAQEVILSGNPWVMCGKKQAHWDEFSGGLSSMISSGFSTWLQNAHGGGGSGTLWRSMQTLDEQRSKYHMFSGPLSLFSVLTSTRDAQASEDRDKVYGLLGVCQETGIEVNYKDSVVDIYCAATLVCLEDCAVLSSILCCVDHKTQREGLPSWTPDWSLSRRTRSLGFSTMSWAIYTACGSDRRPFFSISPNEKELLVEGKIFDGVRYTTDVCLAPLIACEEPWKANQYLATWADMAKQCFPYPSGCTLFDAFWQTLVAGKDGEGNRKNLPDFAEIFSLLLDESTGKHPTFPDQSYSKKQSLARGKGKLELASLRTRKPRKTYEDICSAFRSAMQNRRLGTTGKKYLGLLPRQTEPGDVVCVLVGCHVPFVLRKAESGAYKVVGECYVHGIMGGEVMGMEDVTSTSITLI